MSVSCPECGKELQDNPKFCPECGRQLEAGKKENVDAPSKKRPTKKGMKNLVMTLILIFALLGFFYVLYTYVDFNGIISPTGGVTGTWEGSGTFTNNCANPACRYVGTMNPPSVILDLEQNGNSVTGTITINIPSSQVETLIPGQGCSGFDNSISTIYNGVISGTHLTFFDEGYNVWSLNIIGSGLQGVVTNDQTGCTGLEGSVSLSKK